MNRFMRIAKKEALNGVAGNDGGPFGAVIVKDGAVIARGHNEVIRTNDPTAHAEVVVIRKATAALGRFDLSDCEIYVSCEPCPMCLAAIFWSRIKTVYFGCTKKDAAAIGFDDNLIYEYIRHPAEYGHYLKLVGIDREECLEAMRKWQEKEDKVPY